VVKAASRKRAQHTLYTVGHSRHTLAEFVAILQSVGITRVVDIRSIPRSRTNPQFNIDALPASLGESNIAYTQLPKLGGRRSKSKLGESHNPGWRVRAFQNYADYAETADFREGLQELLALAAQETCAIMCAEAVWWRCHRRIVTDYVLARGIPVVHLLSATQRQDATLTPFATVRPGKRVWYGTQASSRQA
jgi:uncharacterized protein (DUF488 family)